MAKIIRTSALIISIVSAVVISPGRTGGYELFTRTLIADLNKSEMNVFRSFSRNADLVFTVKRLTSFLTITGWASDGYECTIGKVIKGTISDTKAGLYLFHKSVRSKNIRTLKPYDTLILGFRKSEKERVLCEGFREQNGTRWNLLFIKQIRRRNNRKK